jgi:hypothetical protein
VKSAKHVGKTFVKKDGSSSFFMWVSEMRIPVLILLIVGQLIDPRG